MLINALDYGIKEKDFWEMTPAEVLRECNSIRKVQRIQLQEKASLDYVLAQLISKGVSIVLGGKDSFPQIHEAYPNIFDDVIEEHQTKMEEQKINLSATRFKQFAQLYNQKFKNKEVPISNNE